jgi:hypothetical protein
MNEADARELSTQLDRMQAKLDKIDTFLTGGDDPSKGIIVRLDRVEQTQATHTKMIWTAITAGLTALGGLVVKWLTSK